MRINRLSFVLIPLLCLTLAACGKKGPLYLPQPAQPPAPSAPATP